MKDVPYRYRIEIFYTREFHTHAAVIQCQNYDVDNEKHFIVIGDFYKTVIPWKYIQEISIWTNNDLKKEMKAAVETDYEVG